MICIWDEPLGPTLSISHPWLWEPNEVTWDDLIDVWVAERDMRSSILRARCELNGRGTWTWEWVATWT